MLKIPMTNMNFSLEVEGTTKRCPAGEIKGKRMMDEGMIPVLSCEGGCIRGEIARLAANYVAKEEGFGRGCHGDVITVPQSAIAQWTMKAEKIILIDGCFLRCHGRMLENLLGKDKLVQFDALTHYKKYSDLIEIDDVPEDVRKSVARDVADWVVTKLKENGEN